MKLPKCNVCNHQFGWKKTYKSLFKSRTIHCEECGTELKATNLGRFTLLVIIPMMLTGNIIYKDNSDFYFAISIGVMIFVALLISLLLPYLVKYSSDK
jgi:CXXC-20-CXXC protein